MFPPSFFPLSLVATAPARYNSGVFTWPVMSGLSAGWLAAGAGAAAIPVVIHLWAKRRAPVVVFPAARFARSASLDARNRRRLRDQGLLLLRVLALMALAAAFARPRLGTAAFSGGAGGTDGGGASMVILLDASASMRRAEAGVPLFDEARGRALALLRGLDPGRDRAAVVLIDGSPQAVLPQLSGNMAFLIRAVEAAKATLERGDGEGAIAVAEAMMSDDRSPGRRVVVVLSDMQATQWRGVAAGPTDGEWRADRVGGESEAGNVAITDLAVSPASPVQGDAAAISAFVRNYSDEARSVLVRFAGAGRALGETVVNVPAWSERDAAVPTRFEGLGPAPIEAVIAADRFPFDGLVRGEITVKAAPRYALVTSEADEIDPASSGWFIRAALGASGSGIPEILGEADVTDERLSGFDAVAAVDFSRLTPSHINVLRTFASRGGVVLLFTDPGAPIGSPVTHPLESPIWPMALEPSSATRGRIRHSFVTAAMGSEAPLAGVLRAWDGVELTVRHRSALLPRATALLETEHGPVVARVRPVGGGGAVVMFNLDLDPGRSALIRAPIFPALIHAILGHERNESRGAGADGTNLDPAESDFRALSGDEVRAIGFGPASAGRDAGGPLRRALGGGPAEAWPWLLVASMALLVSEGWFRHRAAGSGGVR